MNTVTSSFVDVDWATFDPWRIQPLRHRLMEHALMQPDQLVELGKRLEAKGRVRTHSNTAEPGTPFNAAPRLHPNAMSAADTLQQIRDAKAWMSLLNVQSDPTYCGLVDEIVDGLKAGVDRDDPGMCYRGGWIFITSPAVGESRVLDACLHRGYRGVGFACALARRLAGRTVRSDGAPYAYTSVH